MMSSSKPTFYHSKWDVTSKVAYGNCYEWKQNIIFVHPAIGLYASILADHQDVQRTSFDHAGNYNDWQVKEPEAALMINISCATKVLHIVKGKNNTHAMLNTLQNQSVPYSNLYLQTVHPSPVLTLPIC
jgi:hypothetical protein